MDSIFLEDVRIWSDSYGRYIWDSPATLGANLRYPLLLCGQFRSCCCRINGVEATIWSGSIKTERNHQWQLSPRFQPSNCYHWLWGWDSKGNTYYLPRYMQTWKNLPSSHVSSDSEHQGCLFHFIRSNLRRISSLKLKPIYEQDAEYNEFIKGLLYMPFVPLQSVEDAFRAWINPELNEYARKSLHRGRTQEFVSYFCTVSHSKKVECPFTMWFRTGSNGPIGREPRWTRDSINIYGAVTRPLWTTTPRRPRC